MAPMKIKNVSDEDLAGIRTFVNGIPHPMKSGETIEMEADLAGILIRRLDPMVINASLEKSRDKIVEPEPKKTEKKIEKTEKPKKSK